MATDDISFFFNPKSIAIIGASDTPGKVGNTVTNNIKNTFSGKIFPINPRADSICDIACYKSIFDVKEEIDLAIFVIPGKFVNKAAEECGQKKVKGLIVISAGFKEIGGEGVEREEELIKIGKTIGDWVKDDSPQSIAARYEGDLFIVLKRIKDIQDSRFLSLDIRTRLQNEIDEDTVIIGGVAFTCHSHKYGNMLTENVRSILKTSLNNYANAYLNEDGILISEAESLEDSEI